MRNFESNHNHRLLQLLRLIESKNDGKIAGNVSSKEEWKREADRLEKQGKTTEEGMHCAWSYHRKYSGT